jgi:hypothetical protein
MADMMAGNKPTPDLANLKLGWRAALLMIVGTAIVIGLFLAFGPV